MLQNRLFTVRKVPFKIKVFSVKRSNRVPRNLLQRSYRIVIMMTHPYAYSVTCLNRLNHVCRTF